MRKPSLCAIQTNCGRAVTKANKFRVLFLIAYSLQVIAVNAPNNWITFDCGHRDSQYKDIPSQGQVGSEDHITWFNCPESKVSNTKMFYHIYKPHDSRFLLISTHICQHLSFFFLLPTTCQQLGNYLINLRTYLCFFWPETQGFPGFNIKVALT